MAGERLKMPYIYGEPEGLGRKDHPQKEEDERVAGNTKRKKETIKGKTRFLPRGTAMVSLSDVEEPASNEPNPQERLEIQEEAWSNDQTKKLVEELIDDLRKEKPIATLRSGETTEHVFTGKRRGGYDETVKDTAKKPKQEEGISPVSEVAAPKTEPVGAARLGRDARKFSGKRERYGAHGKHGRKPELPKSLKERKRTREEMQKAAKRFQKDIER